MTAEPVTERDKTTVLTAILPRRCYQGASGSAGTTTVGYPSGTGGDFLLHSQQGNNMDVEE